MEKSVSIMPCLDMQNARVVKGVHFVDIRDAGDPVECAKAYCQAGADELALLDIRLQLFPSPWGAAYPTWLRRRPFSKQAPTKYRRAAQLFASLK